VGAATGEGNGRAHSAQEGNYVSCLTLLNPQVVRHRENIRNAIRPNACHVLITLVGNYALERYVAILHNDVDARHRTQSMALQRREAIDRPKFLPAYLIVEVRKREHFDVVLHSFYSFDVLYRICRVILQNRPNYFAGQHHFVAFHPVFKIVENGKPRQHHQLMPDLVRKPSLILSRSVGR
jgi:hypothetical protein